VNACAALYVTQAAASPAEGYRAAQRSIDNGAAKQVLERFVAFTQSWTD
jgi:anthranilate phosphoribosyltransferase